MSKGVKKIENTLFQVSRLCIHSLGGKLHNDRDIDEKNVYFYMQSLIHFVIRSYSKLGKRSITNLIAQRRTPMPCSYIRSLEKINPSVLNSRPHTIEG